VAGMEDSGLGNERGYTSDSELMYGDNRSPKHIPSRPLSPVTIASSNSSPGGWIIVSYYCSIREFFKLNIDFTK
jgi:hypothetical protein